MQRFFAAKTLCRNARQRKYHVVEVCATSVGIIHYAKVSRY